MLKRISVDDGCASDVRIAKLIEKHKLKGIFYWPISWQSLAYAKGYEPLSYDDMKKIAEKHEIGAHTMNHPHLTKIPYDDAKTEIKACKSMLEYMFDTKVTKFAPPRGYTNKRLTKFTMKHYDTQRLTKEPGLVHIHPDSGANGNKHWTECIDENTEELWCHSWELDKYPEEWDNLERFLESSCS